MSAVNLQLVDDEYSAKEEPAIDVKEWRRYLIYHDNCQTQRIQPLDFLDWQQAEMDAGMRPDDAS